MVTKALLVNLHASHGKADELERLLASLVTHVEDEVGTAAWFALRFGRGHYGVFGAFPGDEARDAHIEGAAVSALLDGAADLLDEPVLLQPLDVLASKLPAADPGAVHKGLLLTFAAKDGHVDAVEEFLRGGRSIVEEEDGTIAWFAFRGDDGGYGIFDAFPDGHARFEHLTGHVPRELAKHAFELLGSFPETEMLNVVAHRLGRADAVVEGPGPAAMTSEAP